MCEKIKNKILAWRFLLSRDTNCADSAVERGKAQQFDASRRGRKVLSYPRHKNEGAYRRKVSLLSKPGSESRAGREMGDRKGAMTVDGMRHKNKSSMLSTPFTATSTKSVH